MHRSFIATALFASLVLSSCSRQGHFECSNYNPCQDPEEPNYPKLTLLTLFHGSIIGGCLPPEERIVAARAMYSLLERGNHVDALKWSIDFNTTTGYVEVFPQQVELQGVCRKYYHEINVDGETSLKATGKACKQTLGAWKIVEEYPE